MKNKEKQGKIRKNKEKQRTNKEKQGKTWENKEK